MTLVLFLLALGATARICRLITDDVIMGWFRAAVIRRFGSESHASTLVRCPWCLSPYVGALVLGSGWLSHEAVWWVFLAAVLTISHLVALAAMWLDGDG